MVGAPEVEVPGNKAEWEPLRKCFAGRVLSVGEDGEGPSQEGLSVEYGVRAASQMGPGLGCEWVPGSPAR